MEVIMRRANLTKKQAQGLILEVVTYQVLVDLGIKPAPLHNPFGKEYAKDQHLEVDLIFIYDGNLYGVECKNLSCRSNIDRKFIEEEVDSRFINASLPFDKKVIVLGVKNLKDASIPSEYDVLELGYQVTPQNFGEAIHDLKSLFNDYLKQNNPKSSSSGINKLATNGKLLYGYRKNKQKLGRVDKKLRRQKREAV